MRPGMRLVNIFNRLKTTFITLRRGRGVFNVRPAVIHVIQTGLLTGAGDIVAQHFAENKTWKDHDIWRTVRLISTGLFIIGPIFHVWYDIFLSKLYIQKTMTIAVKKVILDQGLFAPAFLVLFYGSIGLFELSSFTKTLNRIKVEFVPSMVVNYFIWPAVQLINFYYIHKPQYNILVVNTVSIFWNSFLSWAAHKKIHTTTKFSNDTCDKIVKDA